MLNEALSEIKNLSVVERIAVIDDLWNSITNSSDTVPLTPAQMLELDRRLQKYEQNPNIGEKWSVVKQRIQAKL